MLSFSADRLANAEDHYQIIGCTMATTAQGTVGTTVRGTQPLVAHCNEQVEAPYEDGVKTSSTSSSVDRGVASTAASGS
jgi:hypothetical protein